MTDSEAGVSIELPFSGSANVVNLVTASNHGVPGSFIYRIDSADISVEPPFDPGEVFLSYESRSLSVDAKTSSQFAHFFSLQICVH